MPGFGGAGGGWSSAGLFGSLPIGVASVVPSSKTTRQNAKGARDIIPGPYPLAVLNRGYYPARKAAPAAAISLASSARGNRWL